MSLHITEINQNNIKELLEGIENFNNAKETRKNQEKLGGEEKKRIKPCKCGFIPEREFDDYDSYYDSINNNISCSSKIA